MGVVQATRRSGESDGPLVYGVVATLPSAEVREAYVAWLVREGHVQAVIDGGASTAAVTALHAPDGFIEVESRYVFPDRAAFERYEARVAPALRADGVERFARAHKVTFRRYTGDLLGRG